MIPANLRIGLNPLPWVLTADGFNSSVPILQSAFSEIGTTPFKAMHADPPPGLDPAGYRRLLADYGLTPAPGYFGAAFEQEDRVGLLEDAKRHAAVQAELGNTETFVAASVGGARRSRPAVGADPDPAVLERVIDGLGAVAEVITAEGLRPALHPHVGSLIEVEHDVRAALDSISDSILGFGPDTGHLFWAGMNPVAIIGDYADRVAAVHLKDVHLDQATLAAEAAVDYTGATRGPYGVWTEPGRGDVDLLGALAALPQSFAGWVIVEVDVPEAPSNLASTEISGAWVVEHLGAAVFGGGVVA